MTKPPDNHEHPTVSEPDDNEGFQINDPTYNLHQISPGDNIGDFKILEQIGQGGMGVVYKVYQTSLKRVIALKILHPGIAGNPTLIKNFRQEAILTANLSHPHIVPIFEIENSEIPRFFTMDFVQGRSLKEKVENEGLVPPDQAVRITIQVCEALQYAHDHNIIHRDIKPSNLLLQNHTEMVRITDFGIAQDLKGELVKTDDDKGASPGTPGFASPEQLLGQKLDERTDIFSLGMTLYYMLTGRRAFEGKHRAELVKAFKEQTPLPPSHYNSEVGDEIDNIVLKMIEVDPAKRFCNADEIIKELHKIAGYKLVKLSKLEKKRKEKLKRILRYLLFAGFILIILLIGFLAFIHYLNQPKLRIHKPEADAKLYAGSVYIIEWSGTPERPITPQDVYFSDFEDAGDPLIEWSNNTTDTTPGTWKHPIDRFLGQFVNDTVTLKLKDLPLHSQVKISFDLYIISTWDGNASNPTPDIWNLSVEDGPTLLHTTFSNHNFYDQRQAFPEGFPEGNNEPQLGAAEKNSLGFIAPNQDIIMDSVYRFPNNYHEFSFDHSDPDLILNFSAMDLSDESWGLDNGNVQLISDKVSIEFSGDAGRNWITVDAIYINEGEYGEYEWKVPSLSSHECLIRITDPRYPTCSDITDGFFQINEYRFKVRGSQNSKLLIGGGIEFYSNDFEDPNDTLLEWSKISTDITPGTEMHPIDRFLGPFIDEPVSLTLNNLPEHTEIAISFDLYIMGPWDGNQVDDMVGSDIWEYRVDGKSAFLHTTFSNYWDSERSVNFNQAYPDGYPEGENPPQTGAIEKNTLGYTANFYAKHKVIADTVYEITNKFNHSSSSLVFIFEGKGQHLNIEDGSWGVDNIHVIVIN